MESWLSWWYGWALQLWPPLLAWELIRRAAPPPDGGDE